MPNRMHNILVIQPVVDSTEESKNILDKFYDENNPQKPDNDKEDILDFSLGVPQPPEVLALQGETYTAEQMMNPNNPLNWQSRNWGTKWNCRNSKVHARDDKNLIYDFVTAWSPPIPWLGKISIKYPNCIFQLFFINEFGEDGGQIFIKNGIGVDPEQRQR